jgi:hypothetical protein
MPYILNQFKNAFVLMACNKKTSVIKFVECISLPTSIHIQYVLFPLYPLTLNPVINQISSCSITWCNGVINIQSKFQLHMITLNLLFVIFHVRAVNHPDLLTSNHVHSCYPTHDAREICRT